MPIQTLINIPISRKLMGFALLSLLILLPLLTLVAGEVGLAVFIAVAGLLIALFTHPLVSFTLYFGALFFSDTILPGLPISLNQILAPLFFVATFTYWVQGKTLTPKSRLLPLLTVIVAYFLINGILGLDLENGLLYGRYAVIYLLLAVSLLICLSTENSILALAWIIVTLTAIAAVSGIVDALDKNIFNIVSGHFGKSMRVKGTAANAIVFAWNLLFAFPFAFLLFSEMKSRYTRLLALLMGILILGVAALTFNRQTYVVIVIVLVLCIFLYSFKNRALLLTLLSGMGAVVALTVLPLIVKRMLSLTHLTKDPSFLERRDSVLMGLEMIKKYPLTGIGFGSYSKVWHDFIPLDFNTYYAQYRGGTSLKFMDFGIMSIMVETGIIGLVLFLALLVTILVYSWKFRKTAVENEDRFCQNLASTVIVILVFFTLTSMIQDTFLYTRIWVFYGVAMLLDPRHLQIRKSIPPPNDDLIAQS